MFSRRNSKKAVKDNMKPIPNISLDRDQLIELKEVANIAYERELGRALNRLYEKFEL